MTRKPNNLKRNVFLVVTGLVALYFLFTLNKNKMETSPKKESTLDKVLFGLLIGGAIGSVLGLTVAPDKGKKTRHELKKKGVKLSSKGAEILENEDVMSVVTNKSKGIVSFFTSRIFGSRQKEKKDGGILDWLDDMERIPSEEEEGISR